MASNTEQNEDHPLPWSVGIFDAHCHPTDTMASLGKIPYMNATAFTIMATRGQDQQLVADAAAKFGLDHKKLESQQVPLEQWRGVVPSFGWHPWFSHQVMDDSKHTSQHSISREQKIAHYRQNLAPEPEDSDFLVQLPDPLPLSTLLHQTREHLETYPYALVGEIGLDKAFRLPEAWLPVQEDARDESLTPGGREGRRLSPYRVLMDHQIVVLSAQLSLAGEMDRAVSVHGVQAHGILFETIRKTWKGHEKEVLSRNESKRRRSVSNAHELDTEFLPPERQVKTAKYPPRICLHSYSGPVDFVREYLHPSVPAEVYFSFSVVINFSTAATSKSEEVVKAVPGDKILVESDMHTAGPDMDAKLEDMTRRICTLKGWSLSDGMKQLRQNWKIFVFGNGE